MIRSIKGRVQYLVRDALPKALQRNYAVRSIGAATRILVKDYVARQPDRHPMADERVQNLLRQYQKRYSGVDLSLLESSSHGQNWYNLHLVIVSDHRWMEIRPNVLDKLSQMIESVAAKYGHRISRVGLLADHVHLTLGCVVAQPTATPTSRITVTTTMVSVLGVPCLAGIRRIAPAERARVQSRSSSRVGLLFVSPTNGRSAKYKTDPAGLVGRKARTPRRIFC